MQDDKDTIIEIVERAKATLAKKSRSYVDDADYFARLAISHTKIIQDLMLHSAAQCFCGSPATHESDVHYYCDVHVPDEQTEEMPHADSIRAAVRMLK